MVSNRPDIPVDKGGCHALLRLVPEAETNTSKERTHNAYAYLSERDLRSAAVSKSITLRISVISSN